MKSYKEFISEGVFKKKKKTSLVFGDDSVFEGDFIVNEKMVENGRLIKKYIPRKINGTFNCSYMKLTTLINSPEIVKYNFKCNSNKLTNLEGISKIVNTDFFNESLTNIPFPKEVKGDINLKNIKNLPKIPNLSKINNNARSIMIVCNDNFLTDLKGIKNEEVDRIMLYGNYDLKNLLGCPRINDHLDVDSNKYLKIPYMYVSSKDYTFTTDYDKYLEGLLSFCIKNNLDIKDGIDWPEGFLSDNMKKITSATKKFNL